MSKKNNLDQYYTNMSKVKNIIGNLPNKYFYIEPSAGDGAFTKLLTSKNCDYLAYDLEPKAINIIKSDFFNVKILKSKLHTKIKVIGNPPFGKNSSLAIKFFNHAASFKDVEEIMFILPKTFKKVSIHNKLNLYFHLKKSIDLPYKSFLLDGKEYDVPSCYQVWVRRKSKRKIINITESKNIIFSKDDDYDIAIRRVGGRAGQVLTDKNLSVTSTYFIKVLNEDIYEILKSNAYLEYIKEIRDYTSGIRSVSKFELIYIVDKLINNEC